MKITVIGTGYVGLTLGTCLAELGNDIICVDIDKEKIEKLKKNISPIYEPGIEELLKRNQKVGRLKFITDIKKGIQESDVIFLAVGTPSKQNGAVDLSYVKVAAKSIGEHINGYKVIINKSTVPVGSADLVKNTIKKHQKDKIEFDVVSNPEFLREGSAVKDFMNPDRVIIGTDNGKAKDIVISIYKPLERPGKPILVTDVKSAEMIKYASNAFLATKISFINEIANLCEKVGADVKKVAQGMGLDQRIGPRFLQSGVGYGGSCFPKDVKALIHTGRENNVTFEILEAVDNVNERQKISLIPKIKLTLGNLKDKKIAVWGLSFKPKTDDMREAPSIAIITQLQQFGAKIRVFDPVAQKEAKKLLKDVEYAKDPYDAIKDCDALVIVTEWDEFRELDKHKIKTLLKKPNIFDGRNIYEPEEMKKLGFNYFGVGR